MDTVEPMHSWTEGTDGRSTDTGQEGQEQPPRRDAGRAPQVAATWEAIDRAMARIWLLSPFFSALALFARLEVTTACPTAATDGQTLYFNPDFYLGLTAAERAGVLLHELLHAALLHLSRRGQRDPMLWNIAADIVVNGLIVAESQSALSRPAGTTAAGAAGTAPGRRPGQGESPHFALPDGHIRDHELEGLGVEEVYAKLLQQGKVRPVLLVEWADLLSPPAPDAIPGVPGQGEPQVNQHAGASASGALDAYWRRALDIARQEAALRGQGTAPAGLAREADALTPARLDWRTHLARFATRTPTDFAGFDRRFIYQRLYLETLDAESVQVLVAIDTSGSVSGRELEAFLAEVVGILGSYPQVDCLLYYADAALYGPYTLDQRGPLPPPSGGGGTDFRPFFARVSDEHLQRAPYGAAVCVYLTDGYGTFPETPPDLPTLWVVVAGGQDASAFPFGETVILSIER